MQSHSFRLNNLRNILEGYFKPAIEPPALPGWQTLKKAGTNEQVMALYKNLGGVKSRASLKVHWAAVHLEVGTVLLDSPLHFNRYRLQTLQMPFYDDFSGFSVNNHRTWCRKFERECLKSGMAGQLWTNGMSVKQFGRAEAPGDFSGNGSPAWKQRAFEDFVTDVAAAASASVNIVRLSVYDNLMLNRQLVKTGDILSNPDERMAEALASMVARRLGVEPPPKKERGNLEDPAKGESNNHDQPGAEI